VKISYVLIPFVLIILIFSILPASITITFARCPNGTHKSPSGDCEQVVSHAGMPRCPNGYHRSPNGTCERVGSQSGRSKEGRRNSSPSHNSNANNPSEGPSLPQVSSAPAISFDNNNTSTTASTVGQCDQSLWDHVYNPQRLQVVESCKTVTGVIESIIFLEQDGDNHIRLKMDPEFASLVNSANVNGQHGDLVVEPICQNPVSQQDAISACQDFHQDISIPPVGTHVKVTGSYVLDNQHGGWAEIHPVTSISEIP
jgi:hypothetical protein